MNKEIFTISMGITLFADSRYPGPVSQTPEDVNRFLAPFVMQIFKKYYPGASEDKNNHWNYDTRFTVIRDFGIQNTQHLEFRNRNTGEIIDTAKYSDICNAAKESWKNAVMQAYPGYSHAALAEGMANARFEFFPQNGLLIGFTLLKGLVEQGAEDFMTERERNATQGYPQGVQRTLYLRFDIEKLSGRYGADSYRILFTSIPSTLLVGAILRMGDSADTLAGRENVNVVGITMIDSGQLDMIRKELSDSTAFMAVAATRPFLLAEGLGQEPLVLDGVFTALGVEVQNDNFSWAKNVWDGLKESGKVTDPIIPSENPEADISGILSVEYGNVQEIPFPAETKPFAMLGTNHFVVTNGKSIGKKYGVIDNNGRIVLPITLKHSEAMYGPIKFEMLNEKAILLKSNVFTVFSLNGNPIASFKRVVSLGSELLAVSNGNKFAIMRIDGSMVSSEEFDLIHPFNDGIAIAQKGDTVLGYSTEATVVFILRGIDEIRTYCNGYAVFRRGKKWGAIDTKGNIALEAKWSWLRDCMFDAFVFSESPQPKINLDNFGLVAVGDRVILPCQYKNLEQIDANMLKHGTVIFFQYTVGNTRYTQSLLTFAVIDLQGNELIPQGLAAIGTESEGLRAYARYYSDKHIEFGYMDKDWKSVFIASIVTKVPTGDAFKFGIVSTSSYLFSYKIDDLFSPFSNGKAWVRLSQDGRYLKDGRWINKAGQETTAGEKLTPTETVISPDEKKAQEVLERLSSYFTRLGGEDPHKSCRRVIGDLWEIEAHDGKKSFVFSQMESVNGFSCGLIAVKALSNQKWGYADYNGNLIVPPKYDEAKPFNNNRTWARLGKNYFIIKREAVLNNSKNNAENNSESNTEVL
ncbi:MAG TPA: WG repeat-containing protein [Clostridiaceae bacterium]|nr:WG repeat-containing protein [Clostridiaceae bacterium]